MDQATDDELRSQPTAMNSFSRTIIESDTLTLFSAVHVVKNRGCAYATLDLETSIQRGHLERFERLLSHLNHGKKNTDIFLKLS